MKILFIHNSTGSKLYRIIPQAIHMSNAGHHCRVTGLKTGSSGGITDQEIAWADLVVVEMVYAPKFIDACHGHGTKVVYEIDDLMERVGKKHYAHKDTNWWRTFLTYLCILKSDAVTVTNKYLYDRYKYFNSNISILPNYLDLEYWEKPYLKNDADEIRLGWIGGNSHTEDLEYIAPILKKILEKYPQVKFIASGYGGASGSNDFVEINYGENLFKELPQKQYEFSLGVPVEVYSSKIPSLRLDIGIAPVVDSYFSRGKSNCKSQEYGINRIPGVYSEFLYKDSVVDGKTGFLVKTEQEWIDKISFLIENEKERRQMGLNAYKHIKEKFDFKKYAHKWQEVYELIGSKICNITTPPQDKE